MKHFTYCDFHLGDNMAHLHLLRALVKRFPGHSFEHAVHPCHMRELQDMISDVPTIRLTDISGKPAESIDAWKNADGFWQSHPLKDDYAAFTPDLYARLAGKLGFDARPYVGSLSFNYPKILEPSNLTPEFDTLVINSQPCSGQLLAYDNLNYLDPIIEALMKAGHRVIVTQKTALNVPCTRDYGVSLAGIGNLSLRCKYIVGIATGPMWPTLNVWNHQTIKLRIVMLGREVVNISPNTHHATNREETIQILSKNGLI